MKEASNHVGFLLSARPVSAGGACCLARAGRGLMRVSVAALALLVLMAWPASRAAADTPGLKVVISADRIFKVVDAQGQVTLEREEPATVVPGDQIVYTISYVNQKSEPATNIGITNPVPQDLLYQAGSAAGEDTKVLYSVDGGQTFAAPKKLTVTTEQGFVRPARSSDYTHIRWVRTRPLPPGGEAKVQFSALVR